MGTDHNYSNIRYTAIIIKHCHNYLTYISDVQGKK